jgi:hypothetical protein
MTLPVSALMQREIVSLQARVTALEHMVFQINPQAVREQLDGLEAVRTYLQKVDISEMAPHVSAFLTERLPIDWHDLVRTYGHKRVFSCLARYLPIVNARKELSGARQARDV